MARPSRRPAILSMGVLVVTLALGLVLAACSGGSSQGADGDGADGDRATAPATEPEAPAPEVPEPERPPIQAEEPAGATPPSTAAPGEGPRVESIEVVPPAPCGPEGAEVVVRYATSGADQVVFAVDQMSPRGGQPPPLSGEHSLPVACDDRTHTILLVALDAQGRQAVASAVVNTIGA